MKKYISLNALCLFLLPILILAICHQMHASYTGIHTIPFIDGKVSISLIGRQDYTIWIFKPGFFLYMLISVFFYFSLSKLLLSNGINNKFKIFGIIANLFLCIYIIYGFHGFQCFPNSFQPVFKRFSNGFFLLFK